MVERAARAWRALQANAALLGARGLSLVCGDALEFLASASLGAPGPTRFDVVFLDPPFGENIPEDLWPRVLESLSDDGLVYLECDAMFAGHPQLEVLRQGHAGAVHFHLLGRKRDDQGGISGDV